MGDQMAEPKKKKREKQDKIKSIWWTKRPSACGDRTQRVPVTSQVYFVFNHCYNWPYKRAREREREREKERERKRKKETE